MTLKVELYNLFGPEKWRRFPRNGWLVARYVPCDQTPGGYRRCETVRDFGVDEAAARAFVDAHRDDR